LLQKADHPVDAAKRSRDVQNATFLAAIGVRIQVAAIFGARHAVTAP